MSFAQTKEKLLTAAIFAGIFLPVRLLFYTYVSPHWVGSFGLMTTILVLLFYFSSKGKLGWFGRIIQNHIQRFAKSKAGLGFIILSGFLIYFFGNMIYGIETAPEPLKAVFVEELRSQGINTMDDVQAKADYSKFTPLGFVVGLLVLMTPNELSYSVYDIMNDMSDGWILHFSTVFFVEELELMGLAIYFRYKKLKNKPTTT